MQKKYTATYDGVFRLIISCFECVCVCVCDGEIKMYIVQFQNVTL